jgi:hypothetical protein
VSSGTVEVEQDRRLVRIEQLQDAHLRDGVYGTCHPPPHALPRQKVWAGYVSDSGDRGLGRGKPPSQMRSRRGADEPKPSRRTAY